MKRRNWLVAVVVSLLLPATSVSAQDSDRIWGRILTTDGDHLEGFIRWDRNEANWSDIFNGSRKIVWDDLDGWAEAMREGDGENDRSIEFMGIRVSWDDDDPPFPDTGTSGIRFGHIERLTVTGRQSVMLQLRSGQEVEFSGGSTDIGPEIRGIRVEDPTRGVVQLDWRDLDEIEFFQAPASAHSLGQRLFGTVVDHRGNEYTGRIAWDLDEVLSTDILDGEDSDGNDREIPFGSISAIERVGSGSSIITLTDGVEMELSGSNDVGRGHRGIQVSDATLGQVDVDWEKFGSVQFRAPEPVPDLSIYDGGHRLRGTVETESGEHIEGWIRWDADETYSWELLDGQADDVTFEIEFGRIARIQRVSRDGADITLLDGRVIQLDDSNDVDENNRGVFIETDSGRKVVIDWFDFAAITFDHR